MTPTDSQSLSEPLYDTSIWDEVEPASSRRLIQAALEAFAARGYHAATTREISEQAELSPTAMYVYYRSKVDLLVKISVLGHTAVLDAVDSVTADSEDPTEYVRRFVHAFVAWHARNHSLARVIQYELDSIPESRFGEVRSLRRKTDRRLRTALRDGVDQGAFTVPNVEVTTLTILSLGIDVARWYKLRPSPDALASAQADLVLRMIAAPDA
jgi:AcrR family transcriptional regulator